MFVPESWTLRGQGRWIISVIWKDKKVWITNIDQYELKMVISSEQKEMVSLN